MNSKIRNVAAATGLAGSLLIGGVTIAAAQTSTTKPATGSTAKAARPDQTTRLKAVLAPLVTKGTITQAQADAVAAALAANDGGMGGRRGPGGMGMGGPMANHADTIAKALGISTTDVQTALQSGKNIAQVATEKGVSVQKVIDAYVAEEKQEHPEMAATDVTARITAMVNGQAPAGGPGGGRGGHGPHGGNGTQDAPAAAANTTGTTVKA